MTQNPELSTINVTGSSAVAETARVTTRIVIAVDQRCKFACPSCDSGSSCFIFLLNNNPLGKSVANVFAIFCCAMLCKRSLYCHAVCVCVRVCVSDTFVHSVKTNKLIIKILSPSGIATPSWFIRTKQHGNIPTETPLTGASNACGIGRNRDSESISGFTACC